MQGTTYDQWSLVEMSWVDGLFALAIDGTLKKLLPSLVSDNGAMVPMVISQCLFATETRECRIDVELERVVMKVYIMIYLE